MSSKSDNLEDYLLSDQFYSSTDDDNQSSSVAPPATISASKSSNHVQNLRNSIQIVHSISSNTINKSLLPNSEKTSFMKNSPSMKALESILLEKNGKGSVSNNNTQIIEEEDEEEEEEEEIKPLNINHKYAISPYNNPMSSIKNSTVSIQTFETAKSQQRSTESLHTYQHHQQQYQHQHQSNHQNKRSISTLDDSGYSTDDTPILSQPATFQNLKQVKESPQLKIIDNSLTSNTEAETQEETLIDDNDDVIHPHNIESLPSLNDNHNSKHSRLPNTDNKLNLVPKIDFVPQKNFCTPSSNEFPIISSDKNNVNKVNYSSSQGFNIRGESLVSNGKQKDSELNNSPSLNPNNYNYKSLLSSGSTYQPFSDFSKHPPPPPPPPPPSSIPTTFTFATTSTNTTTPAPLSKPALHQHKPKRSSMSTTVTSLIPPAPVVPHEPPKSLLLDFSDTSDIQQEQLSPPIQQQAKLTSIPPSPRKSPHLRSQSNFSTFNNQKDQPPVPQPGKHKRSNTLGDISKLAKDDTANDKRNSKFSFKSLFKSKSKNHALSEMSNTNNNNTKQLPPSQPKKLSSKSYSTSNINTIANSDNNNNTSTKNDDDVKPKRLTRYDSSSSLLNVFKKNKSSENLGKLSSTSGKTNDKQTSKKDNNQEKPIGSGLSPDPEAHLNRQIFNQPPVIPASISSGIISGNKSSLIREVSDDDFTNNFVPHQAEYKNVQDLNDQDEEDEEYNDDSSIVNENFYDSKNTYDPPKKISNPTYGEEMGLISNDLTFGSPFKVKYNSRSASPVKRAPMQMDSLRVPKSSNELSKIVTDNSNNNNNNNINNTHDHLDGTDFNKLAGEALFPKSLTPQEVESIVSLERSRSMRSIKSKRNSFIGYNGSDENIIHYSGPSASPNSGITRSNSILKNSGSRRNISDEIGINNSIDANVIAMSSVSPEPEMTQDQVPVVEPEQSNLVNENTDNNYDDLIEFTDFIDIDNLSFSTSPQQLLSTRSPRASLPPSPIKKPEFIVITTDDDVSPSPEPVKAQPEVPQVPQFSIPTSSAVPPPPQQHQHQQPQQQLNVVTNSETIQKPELSIVTPPVSQETRDDEIVHDEKVIISLSSSPEEITKEQFQQQQQEQQTTAQGKRDSYYSNSPLTPNLVQINENRYPQSPESITSPVEKQSPILEKALEHNRPIVDSNGKDIFTNRPISMSFNGLKGPIFGGKLAPHDLRVSESHQSFSISFDDDSSNSGGVGGGFGTDSTDEEEGDDFSNLENDGINANDIGSEYHREINKENNVQLNSQPKSLPNIPKISKRFGTESNKDNYYAPSNFQPPPKAFSHNKIPSISDSSSVNSSPRSLGSIISRKWGKKPSQSQNNSPLQYQSPRFMTKTNGVRFSSRIILYDTYNGEEYDRHPDTATCNQLTPLLAQQIKEELNAFKSSMDIHIESRENTHFF